jgi:outer membrane protein OmpA-like peptidoglycan-associated protein
MKTPIALGAAALAVSAGVCGCKGTGSAGGPTSAVNTNVDVVPVRVDAVKAPSTARRRPRLEDVPILSGPPAWYIHSLGVEFEEGTDEIKMTPETSVVLHTVLGGYQRIPSLTRLRVEGYAGAEGAPGASQLLSERRAKAVVRWFVDHGLEPSRLEPVGCGARVRIRPNNQGRNEASGRGAVFRIEELNHEPVEDCPVACAPSP